MLFRRLERVACCARTSSADYHVPSRRGDLLLDGRAGQPLVAAPPGVQLTTSVVGAGGAFRMFLGSVGSLRALFFHLSGGALIGVPVDAATTAAVLTTTGRLALDGPELQLVDSAGVHRLAGAVSVRHVLSGRGTTDV